jgi:hypothetical protein
MTIDLIDDQVLITDETVCVAVGGTYQPTDLVGCYNIEDATKEVLFAHQANFIATGQCV